MTPGIQPRALLERHIPRPLHPFRFAAWALLLASLAGCQDSQFPALELQWGDIPDRPWAGPELWTNRLQDWEVREGKLQAIASLPMRTAHLLTRRTSPETGDIRIRLVMGSTDPDWMESGGGESTEPVGVGGVLLGAGGPDLDFRKAALIHHSPGPGGGLFFGVDDGGHVLAWDFSNGNRSLARSQEALGSTDSLELVLSISKERPATGGEEGRRATEGVGGGAFTVTLEAHSLDSPASPVRLELPHLPGQRLSGGMALVSHAEVEEGPSMWFSAVRVEGPGVEVNPHRVLGPILGAQHTVNHDVLSLTAQLFPISPVLQGPTSTGRDSVSLEFQDEDGSWRVAGSAPVTNPGYTATFVVEGWAGLRLVPYRLTLKGGAVGPESPPYAGSIQPTPEKEREFVVAAFTGNHNVASPGVDGGSFNWETDLWFPHGDMVDHVLAHDPDFLFFSGDQVYEGASPTRADFDHPYRDYLYKWYLWLWAFRDLTSQLPSVAIPDDHDVFHGNVWGAGGRSTPPGLAGAQAQDQGGYKLPPDWVNMVQRTQTSHFPEPWDPSPSDEGIETYFTEISYGGVSFAVLEDRKFKSPPKLLLPQAEVWNGWAQDPTWDPTTGADAPGASLLGASQEDFLEEWASDWAGGTWMKVVLSQTIFGNVATIPNDAMSGSVIPSLPIPEPGEYVEGDKPAADMDSNGWPPAGRDRALRAMRKGFAVHLAGDQHLASTIQYGVEEFGDGPFALCVPSVANFWPRRWYPPVPDETRTPGAPAYTGDFLDGFGNPMTVFAVSNPARWGREPTTLHNRAPGYGIARFNPTTREVSLEAWPRWADPVEGDSPYPGWPVRFHQDEGYGREAFGFLPTLIIKGMVDPVVQVVSELGGEILYTIRIRGTQFIPKVFGPGSYTVRVGEPGTESMRVFLGLEPSPASDQTMEVRFDDGSD